MKTFKLAVVVLFCSLLLVLLSSCGQNGPLYLPDLSDLPKKIGPDQRVQK